MGMDCHYKVVGVSLCDTPMCDIECKVALEVYDGGYRPRFVH